MKNTLLFCFLLLFFGLSKATVITFIPSNYQFDWQGGYLYIDANNDGFNDFLMTAEATLGIDLVEHQLRVAAGEPLSLPALERRGHAIELRVCAEDPDKRFFPQPGTLGEVTWPAGDGIRVDAGVESGSVVPPYYDSLLAKVIGHGASRAEAIARLRAALERTSIGGLKSNLEMHKRILDDEQFQAGHTTTAFIEERLGLKA